ADVLPHEGHVLPGESTLPTSEHVLSTQQPVLPSSSAVSLQAEVLPDESTFPASDVLPHECYVLPGQSATVLPAESLIVADTHAVGQQASPADSDMRLTQCLVAALREESCVDAPAGTLLQALTILAQHWAEITLRQHRSPAVAMLCFNYTVRFLVSVPVLSRLFNAGRSGLSRAGQAHTAEVVRAQASLPTAASEEAPRLRVADVRQQRRGADKPRARSRPAGENATPGKRSSSDRQSATAPNTLRSISPTGSALRANPCSEGTDPFCRLPLSALFNWPEAVHLGDLLRIWSVPNATGDAAFCGDIVAISGQPGSSDCVPYEEKKTLSGTADGCSPSSEALPRAPVPRASSRANRADSGDEAPRPRKRQPETRVYIFVSRSAPTAAPGELSLDTFNAHRRDLFLHALAFKRPQQVHARDRQQRCPGGQVQARRSSAIHFQG
ncbi:hypothetical protein TTRE_0000966501, partial [Trichuris trichiura]